MKSGQRKAESGDQGLEIADWGLAMRAALQSEILSPATRNPQPATRRGISLLEVLISIGILSVGLLGLMALIPLGHHDIVEATKMDRGATLGRVSFRDLEVRGYLRPDMWCDKAVNGTSPMLWSNGGVPTPPDAFVIDPLLCGYALAHGQPFPDTFPYGTPCGGNPPVIPRVTLRAAYNSSSQPGSWSQMTYSMADRLCRLGDDLAFIKPDDAKLPPAMSYSYDSPGGNRMTRQFEGNYCWLVTVAPAVTEMGTDTRSGFMAPPPAGWTPPAGWNQATWTTRQYTVSVAVCYKRKLSDYITPDAVRAERMVSATVATGLGGGEVVLETRPPANKTWLEKLKPGAWLMLSATVPTLDANGSPATDPNNNNQPITRMHLDWYRINAVDDGADLASSGQRHVTLHGPDWPTSAVVNAASVPIATYATLVDGVVGVYQKTITLDGTSPWRQ